MPSPDRGRRIPWTRSRPAGGGRLGPRGLRRAARAGERRRRNGLFADAGCLTCGAGAGILERRSQQRPRRRDRHDPHTRRARRGQDAGPRDDRHVKRCRNIRCRAVRADRSLKRRCTRPRGLKVASEGRGRAGQGWKASDDRADGFGRIGPCQPCGDSVICLRRIGDPGVPHQQETVHTGSGSCQGVRAG